MAQRSPRGKPAAGPSMLTIQASCDGAGFRVIVAEAEASDRCQRRSDVSAMTFNRPNRFEPGGGLAAHAFGFGVIEGAEAGFGRHVIACHVNGKAA